MENYFELHLQFKLQIFNTKVDITKIEVNFVYKTYLAMHKFRHAKLQI